MHLAASMRVVAIHLSMRRVSVSATKYMVAETARQAAEGAPLPAVERLREHLERETGCSIAQLAAHAQRWSAQPSARPAWA